MITEIAYDFLICFSSNLAATRQTAGSATSAVLLVKLATCM